MYTFEKLSSKPNSSCTGKGELMLPLLDKSSPKINQSLGHSVVLGSPENARDPLLGEPGSKVINESCGIFCCVIS